MTDPKPQKVYPHNPEISFTHKDYLECSKALRKKLFELEKEPWGGVTDTDALDALVQSVQVTHRAYIVAILKAQHPSTDFEHFLKR